MIRRGFRFKLEPDFGAAVSQIGQVLRSLDTAYANFFAELLDWSGFATLLA